MTSRLISH